MQITSQSSSYYLQQLQQSLFNKADANSDGGISLEEFSAGDQAKSADKSKIENLFKQIDSSGDNTLSSDELSAFFSSMASSTQGSFIQLQQQGGFDPATDLLNRADEDGNGTISADEFAAAGPQGSDSTKSAELFSKIDSDGDGELTSDELSAFGDEMKSGKAPPPPPSGSSQGTSLADLLLEATSSDDEEDGSTQTTSTSSTTDISKQLEAYLQRMTSLFEGQAGTGRQGFELTA
ncbi:MAG: hypothetical protein GC184_00195 [Rhizobiales bacterium]|nr:hypothetical protein [Hyphomicrobiales bacterium]